MPKTLTVGIDDATYRLIAEAAAAEIDDERAIAFLTAADHRKDADR